MHKIAIAVRDTDLFLEATVKRAATNDVYVNFPRNRRWHAHGSYHASGQHHQKSFGQAFLRTTKQKPDASFKGAVNVVTFGINDAAHKALNRRCNPNDFRDVFEIQVSLLRPEKFKTHVSVDLVEPGVDPLLIPGAKVLQQQRYKDAEPWIVLTLMET